MKRIYKCNNCFAIYESKKEAKNCHYGDIVIYDIEVKNRKFEYSEKKER